VQDQGDRTREQPDWRQAGKRHEQHLVLRLLNDTVRQLYDSRKLPHHVFMPKNRFGSAWRRNLETIVGIGFALPLGEWIGYMWRDSPFSSVTG
jgi:hypothetical protein